MVVVVVVVVVVRTMFFDVGVSPHTPMHAINQGDRTPESQTPGISVTHRGLEKLNSGNALTAKNSLSDTTDHENVQFSTKKSQLKPVHTSP